MIGEAQMLERFERVHRQRDGDWLVTCPAHDDRTPSLHLTLTDVRWLLDCKAGCPFEDVRIAARLEWSDLFADSANGGTPHSNQRDEEAVYRYTDEDGTPLFEVVRFAGKRFAQRQPDGTWGLNGTRRVVYNLPAVVQAAQRGGDVIVCEGEKDAEAVARLGIPATCNPGGAGKWRDEYSEALRGAKVVIVADRDEPGREHARQVAKSLRGVAAEIDVVEPAIGKDISDHLAAGKGIGLLVDVSAVQMETAKEPATVDVVGPVHGGELLDEIAAFIRRFVVLPSDEVGDLLALWVLHTHSFEAAWATPYLRVTSAAPSSGKTLLLEVLAAITRNGWHAINPSVAVLYRKIDRQAPTLLLDEMDNYPLDERRDALAVLNAGYKRGARVDRCKENGDLVSFSAFCPKAYAGIDSRALVDTLLSRSITIRLEKRLLSESVEMWIAPLTEPEAVPLREQCERWAVKHQEALALHKPTLPDGLINREAEVWWALLAIAEFVGGDWPKRARSAAAVLVAGGDSTDGVSEQVQLLADIRDAFADGVTISTKELTTKLNALEESPWGARRKGEGLDGRGLARLLRPFGIRPRSVRLEDGSIPKGYQWHQFEDVFARHLPEAPQAPQAPQPAPHGNSDVADVADVADKSPPAQIWEASR